MNALKTVKQNGYSLVEEKKSKFISSCYNVSTVEEALLIVDTIKKEYKDARHVVYAYRISENILKEKFTDDGEPQGTAGKPILEMLQKEKLEDVLIIVVRYFGGTLLGTGGLVKCYTTSAKQAIHESQIITNVTYNKYNVNTTYSLSGKLEQELKINDFIVTDKTFTDSVSLDVLVKKEYEQNFKEVINKVTNGTSVEIYIGEVICQDILSLQT